MNLVEKAKGRTACPTSRIEAYPPTSLPWEFRTGETLFKVNSAGESPIDPIFLIAPHSSRPGTKKSLRWADANMDLSMEQFHSSRSLNHKETAEVAAIGVTSKEHGVRVEAPKMLWADSVSTTYLIYCIPYVPIGLHIPKEECGSDEMRYSFRDMKSHQVIRRRDTTFVDLIYGARAQVGAQIRVRGPKTVGASRIVKDQMKNTLKMEHPPRREAPRLHMYEDPPESLGLR
ncbi:hypothetical protein Tco_1453326 [Tanacetum coccineum]